MKYPLRRFTGLALSFTAFANPGTPVGPPTFENEQLRYSINWPSGLSLGEAQLGSSRQKDAVETTARTHFEFSLDAGIPGFSVSDRYRSDVSQDFCSVEFQRTATHGQKKSDEKTTFDQQAGTATRETKGGGKSELKTPACGKDALAYLYFVRRELSQGRLPAPQTVFFGAPYEIKLAFAGTQSIRLGDKQVDADRVTASVKGAASEFGFEVFFLKDAARTPALVRVPLPMGTTFSMPLVR